MVFIGLLLPLWALGALIEGVKEGDAFAFDFPIMAALHSISNTRLDRAFIFISSLGYAKGVLPADVLLVFGLFAARYYREGIFAAVSMVGSLALNIAAKQQFARARPDQWIPIVPVEQSYSFPSGHAMASMTLGVAVVLLTWHVGSRRELRWSVALLAASFAFLVGVSRVYLGLHYPSDILAGWAASAAWVVGVYGWAFPGGNRPFLNT